MSGRKLFRASFSSPDLNPFEEIPKACHSSPNLETCKSGTTVAERENKLLKETTTVTNKVCKRDKFVSDAKESDLMGMPFSSTNFNQKLPYSKEEDEIIIKFVLDGQNIFKVTSILIWKFLESKKKNPKRTYQSLKNRFLRNIKPHLFTTYGHLIKDKETEERILAKFPELKNTMGRRGTLSGLKLPERKQHPSRVAKDIASRTNENETREDFTKTPQQMSDPDFICCSGNAVQPVPSVRPERVVLPKPISSSERVAGLCPLVRLERIELPEAIVRPERTARPKPSVGLEDNVKPQEADRPERVSRPQPVTPLESRSCSDFFIIPNYERIVKINTDGVNISVNFTSAEYPKTSSLKSLGIYQKFERLKRKNKLVLCPACGIYSSPTALLQSYDHSDDFIFNSVGTPKTAAENSSKSNFDSEPRSSTSSKSLILRSSPKRNLFSCSPSLSSNSAENKSRASSPSLVEGRTDATPVSLRHSEVSNSPSLKEVVNLSNKKPQTRSLASSKKEPHKIKNMKKKGASANPSCSRSRSKSRKMANPSRKRALQDSIEDSNSGYSNKKIICTDEEAVLLRNYLKKQFDSISSNANLTAFLLESSPDAETPELTLDFEANIQNDKKETESPSTSNSSLFQNMKKMLCEKHVQNLDKI